MNLDTTLRETLESYATRAPHNAGLLDAARQRSYRRRRHQRLAVAGVALAAIAGVVIGGLSLLPPPAEPVSPAGATVLEPPAYELPTFPLTPGWTPEGAAEPYVVVDGSIVTLVHPHEDGGRPMVTVHVEQPGSHRLPSELAMGGGYTEDTIHGYPLGMFTTTQDGVRGFAVAWRDDTGRLVVVNGAWWDAHDPDYPGCCRTVDELVRYAEGLVEQPVPARLPFTFDLAPLGWEPVAVERDTITLGRAPVGELSVRLFDADGSAAWQRTNEAQWQDHREPVRVGVHDGELWEGDRARTVRVFLAEDRVLHVASTGAQRLSRDDLLRFAEGVHLTPHASPGSG